MKTYQLMIALLAGAACSSKGGGNGSAEGGGIPAGDGTAGDGGSGTVGQDDGGPADGQDDGDGTADDDDGPGGPGVNFDVGVGGGIFCMGKPAGIFCDDNVAVECGAMGNVLDQTTCVGDFCLEGTGCVECLAGQFDCQGPNIMACDDTANPPDWTQTGTCDPASNQTCDIATGTCIPLAPTGTTVPTGVYYQYAFLQQGSTPFLGGYDVDSFEDRIYVNGFNSAIDIYEVQLLDSDGDGVMEPNQHPDNPDETGPIEERVLTFIESVPWGASISISQAELYALDDRFFMGGNTITEMVMATGTKSVVSMSPGFTSYMAQIGYDDVNEVWYASNESNRRVFQRDSVSGAWGHAFEYPPLAGDHMDGLEVVTDPETGIPYVYVSDMTSDFVGQYRKDPDLGWVQENLFEYQGTAGVALEGMGFGALNHFWATGGSSLYEIGGGDLSEYLEPPG